MEVEYVDMLVKLFEMGHLDNMKVLKALICPEDDVQPLFDCSAKRRVGFSEHMTITIIIVTRTYIYKFLIFYN